MTRGERIKDAREKAGFSQVALADKIKVSKQLLYKYENNIVTNIPSDKIEAISEACNVSPDYLMGWSEETKEKLRSIAEQAKWNAEISVIMEQLYDPERQQVIDYAAFLLSKHNS